MSMVTELETELKNVTEEIAACPRGSLMVSEEKTRGVRYFCVSVKNGKRVRKGITSDRETVEALARKAYLTEKKAIIESNIRILRETMEEIGDLNSGNVMKSLSPSIRRLPQDLFRKTMDDQDPRAVWASETYPHSSYRPEAKVHLTSRGLAVRSKSEMLIAERLYEYGIPFRYEPAMHIDRYEISPDFTVMTPSGKVFYWEHCGMTGNRDYIEKHKWKMNLYETRGIVPWKNLIVTYDDENGHINLAEIDSIITNKLL